MKLAALLASIETGGGSMTEADIAGRTGSSVTEVRAMLAALRAAGRLGPQRSDRPGTDACASTNGCAFSCPGPADCPLIINIGAPLEVRRPETGAHTR